eukprot:TRINITY_DN36452_c0_g1_i1.p1 TRINITY_DN36452_c0_g1~~TRINITY_DN36452_c0_g1_i1.p1  ORF type:complete len:271 (+),score=-33.89 TRINITY_DN36452_c0_g1_i1:3-815(+)
MVDQLVFVFFFFKQKTAYEIMPSLVGSEMCIRDRYMGSSGDQFPPSDQSSYRSCLHFFIGHSSSEVEHFFPETYTENSPNILSLAAKSSRTSITVPAASSSCSFVSSRPMTIRLSPSISARSVKSLSIRNGDSQRTNAYPVSSSSLSRLRLRPGLGERNPSKMTVLSMPPETDNSVAKADAPGIGTTVYPASRAMRTSTAPGSLKAGVPASLAYATSCPFRRISRTRLEASSSLRARQETSGVLPGTQRGRRFQARSRDSPEGAGRCVCE